MHGCIKTTSEETRLCGSQATADQRVPSFASQAWAGGTYRPLWDHCCYTIRRTHPETDRPWTPACVPELTQRGTTASCSPLNSHPSGIQLCACSQGYTFKHLCVLNQSCTLTAHSWVFLFTHNYLPGLSQHLRHLSQTHTSSQHHIQ